MVQAARQGPKVSDLTNTIECVKLVSSDGKVFYLNSDVACQSKLLKEQEKTAHKE